MISFIKRLYIKFVNDDAPFLAAVISYFALFSIVPLLLLLTSVVGYSLSIGGAEEAAIGYIKRSIPQFSGPVADSLRAVIAERGRVGIVALLIFLWGGTAVFDALHYALNKVWEVQERRAFWLNKLLAVGAVIVLGFLLLVVTFASVLAQSAQSYWLTQVKIPLVEISFLAELGIRFGVLLVTFVTLVLTYRFIPSRPLKFKQVWVGALVAAVAWEVAEVLFALYSAKVAAFDALYGSLGVVFGLLAWLYLSSAIIILGSEVSFLLSGDSSSSGPPPGPPSDQG